MLNKCNELRYSSIVGSLLLVLNGCTQLPTFNENPDNQNLDKDVPTYQSASQQTLMKANLPMPTQELACGDISDNETITVKGHLQLASECDLTHKNVRFVIDSSDTSLNCMGAFMSVSPNEPNMGSAITIRPKTDAAISNITVANCYTKGYSHALNIRQHTTPNLRYASGFIDPDANRALAPHNITIMNVSSIESKNSGIFVGDHVHHVDFSHLAIVRSGTVGLYLEFGSQYISVTDSLFVGNGFRTFKSNREAIAIDSSSHNTIRHNEFIHNGAGAVHLYRNCFEHANDPSRSNHFKRTESAANNLILENIFREEPVGVWVASRQSRNLKGFECGAYLLADSLFFSYHMDSAKNNEIVNNTFYDVDIGIIVEDDGTHIIGNDFTQIKGLPYRIGSPIRKQYAYKVGNWSPDIIDTVIEDNKE